MVQGNEEKAIRKTAAKAGTRKKKTETRPEEQAAVQPGTETAAPATETLKKKRVVRKKAAPAEGVAPEAAAEAKEKTARKPRVSKAKKATAAVAEAPAAAPAPHKVLEQPPVAPAKEEKPAHPAHPHPAHPHPAHPAHAPAVHHAPAHPKVEHKKPEAPKVAAAPAPAPVKPTVHRPAAPAAPAPVQKAPATPAPQAPAVAAAPAATAVQAPVKEAPRLKGEIKINELTTVRDLAEKMNLKPGDLIKKLLMMGSLATINQKLDTDTATLLAQEFGYGLKFESLYGEEKISEEKDDPAKLKPRWPVVTIMGHVDHGKTSLLDSIRESRVAEGEAGGITQHIGAYKVKTPKGDIAFLDTPGHEAFTAMRSRGAQATDIVVLVVSAADGVMPQTVEAIDHARAAGVPIIVAINKIDLPVANPQQTKQELTKYNLVPEEWGGDTIMVEVSAKKRINIDQLLEMILLRAEIMELKANPDRAARGVVIEAKLDSRRGPVATVLVQTGTLRIGDNFVIGMTYGKIRAMIDEHGTRLLEAGPSTPVEILGINAPPQAGDAFVAVADEREAREIAQSRQSKAREDSLKPRHHISLEDISAGKTKELRIILKTDVQGSLGAVSDSIERLTSQEIALRIIHSGAGSITESDVMLAAASDAMIIGFNLRPDASVERLAESEGVSIRVYRIIYELIADVRAAMEGLLEPAIKEVTVGKCQVKQVFKASKIGTIAGCTVTDGKIQRSGKVRLLRDNVIVYEGSIASLRRFKEDVREVEKGFECGLGLENFSDYKPGDIMEVFTQEKVARKL